MVLLVLIYTALEMVPFWQMVAWVIFHYGCNLVNKISTDELRLFSLFCPSNRAVVTTCIYMILPTLGMCRILEERLLLQRVPFIIIIITNIIS